jgi:hypothetical protein
MRMSDPSGVGLRDSRVTPPSADHAEAPPSAAAEFGRLVEDAGLVADAGVRLGRIKDPAFLTALGEARQALEAGNAPPAVVASLQNTFNSAVRDILPITLSDLRSGWRPFAPPRPQERLGTLAFGVFCLALLAFTAYTTQIYDQARSVYALTVELQDARGAEQAIRLFGLLKRNQKDVVESLISGKKDFLYEAFGKALFDLQTMNLKFQAYAPIVTGVLNKLDMVGSLTSWRRSSDELSNPTSNPVIAQYLRNYASGKPPADGSAAAARAVPPDLNSMDIQALLNIFFQDQKAFNSTINVGFDPLAPNDYYSYLYQLRVGISYLSAWVLPALYGMLGAAIFHMRRILDPGLPNPSWLRFTYRIVLGGFAGIVLIWFWAPTAPRAGHPEFATLTAFGVAFLVGFSTDVFFQVLDRLVGYLSQAVGEARTT